MLLACSWCTYTYAQNDSTYSDYKYQKPAEMPENFWDKAYTGGDLMLWGGGGGFYFNISPMLGYRPNNGKFSYGIGATYQYSSFNDLGYTYQFSLYGARAFLRQELGNYFFVHGEYENYFTRGRSIFSNKTENISIPCANAFIGYKQNFSEYSYYYFMIGYEFIGDRYAGTYVYPVHPILIKVGYIFDLKRK